MRRGAAGQPLAQVGDEGRDANRLAGESFLQVHQAKVAGAAPSHHRVGGGGGDVVFVFGQRCPAGSEGANQDLVVLEIRRLEEDAHPVGKLPALHADLVDRGGFDDLGRRRRLGDERRIRGGVLVGRDLERLGRGENRQ